MEKYLKWFSVITAIVLLALVANTVNIAENPQGQKVLTIGFGVEALGTADYTCDGVADNVQFQAAMNALPAGGGELVVMGGNYVFAATVTRAIANVTITGVGRATYFAFDGATDLFTAGGNNWTFRDLRTDAGDIGMGATTGWSWENVTINADYYAYRTPRASTTGADWEIPTGRGATYVVAASDAPAHVKAQADYLGSDYATNALGLQAALDAANALGGKQKVAAYGTFTGTVTVNAVDNVDLDLFGSIVITITNNAAVRFNNITNTTWVGGTISLAGANTYTGYNACVWITGTCDRTVIFRDVRAVNISDDAAVDELFGWDLNTTAGQSGPLLYGCYGEGGKGKDMNRGFIHWTGNPEMYDCVGQGATAAYGNANDGFCLSEDGFPYMANCTGIGGNGTSSNGILSYNAMTSEMVGCTGIGGTGTQLCFGIDLPESNAQTLTGCIGIAGKNGTGGIMAGISIRGNSAPILNGCVGKLAMYTERWDYVSDDNGRFRPFAGYAYQLYSIQVWMDAPATPGEVLDIGTTPGGNEIANDIPISATGNAYFSIVRSRVAADGYLYATPSAAPAGTVRIYYAVMYDSTVTHGLYMNTKGYALINGGQFIGTNDFGVVRIAGATPVYKISGAQIINLDATRRAIYSDDSISNAPFYNCTFVGTIHQANILSYGNNKAGKTGAIADGANIAHGLGATPTSVSVSGSVAGEIITVTAIDATNITVAIKKNDGSAGTNQVIYWRATLGFYGD